MPSKVKEKNCGVGTALTIGIALFVFDVPVHVFPFRIIIVLGMEMLATTVAIMGVLMVVGRCGVLLRWKVIDSIAIVVTIVVVVIVIVTIMEVAVAIVAVMVVGLSLVMLAVMVLFGRGSAKSILLLLLQLLLMFVLLLMLFVLIYVFPVTHGCCRSRGYNRYRFRPSNTPQGGFRNGREVGCRMSVFVVAIVLAGCPPRFGIGCVKGLDFFAVVRDAPVHFPGSGIVHAFQVHRVGGWSLLLLLLVGVVVSNGIRSGGGCSSRGGIPCRKISLNADRLSSSGKLDRIGSFVRFLGIATRRRRRPVILVVIKVALLLRRMQVL